MFEDFSFEALAHYTRGMATIFFVIFAVITYFRRKRNRMSFMLFVTVSYLALGFLKDIIFVLPLFSESSFVENLSSLFDVSCTPFVCAFFLESTRPGMVKRRDILLSYLLFAAFMPLYCLIPSDKVILGAYLLAALTALYTMVLVPFNVVRYNKVLAENISYTKNVSVNWIITCAFTYFLWLTVYAVCFWETTWLSEAVFDVFSIIVWGILFLLCRNHSVLSNLFSEEGMVTEVQDVKAVEGNHSRASEELLTQSAEENKGRKVDFIAGALQQCMETEKLYLNPHLSLNDLASAAGTNKTYISTFINSRGKTFYDYVNEYRIAEACRILDTSSERLSMADVATRSGFNSMSTFNRYFLRIKGVSPSAYYRSRN